MDHVEGEGEDVVTDEGFGAGVDDPFEEEGVELGGDRSEAGGEGGGEDEVVRGWVGGALHEGEVEAHDGGAQLSRDRWESRRGFRLSGGNLPRELTRSVNEWG